MPEVLRETLDLTLFWEYRQALLKGLWMSLGVFACAAAIAVLAGLGIALLRRSRFGPLRWAATLHTEISRNSPDYIMIVWVHFVLPLLIGTLLARRFEFDPFVSSVIALGYVYSGYFAETFRAGIEAVPRGHFEAAQAFGMTERRIMWRIVLPQVVRRMLPESTNQFISMFKATSIVSLIAVPDLMYQVSMVSSQEMRPMPLYTGAALAYFVIVFCAATLLQTLSKRWRAKVFA
ncbi:putative glutamine ABC transporter permease protein GlnM [Variovorax sp. PBS-H4]|uniref:amino acid ABC transporter permease n=1 Tax=Variovorax sp. PBS-H4 TaxID=434008 RepID=UPI001318ABE3|nr:amino acid ABC transporter permease [Variovorax sp. PBS-H4]VTU40755.1 putative glutamine ABC transporter permease protein GlnM [Variovorax sp. PBS-H4]